jgi:hypothetical protein
VLLKLPETGAAQVWAAFALLLGLATAPIFATVLPPLFDYPNHLARMHLLLEGGNRFFEVRWAVLPNLAEDLLVPPLARVMPLDLAAKLFLVAIFALLVGGTLCLNRFAARGWRPWPLLAFLLLYSRTFLWGFLNYMFGLGCALCGGALWLALETRRPWLRILASTMTALVCFVSHLAAWGIYLLIIAGLELPPALAELRRRSWAPLARRLAIAAPQFLLPAAIFLWLSPHLPAGAPHYAPWRKLDLLFTVFDNYSRVFDVPCFTAFLGAILGLAVAGWLRFDRRIGSACGLVAVAYLLLPDHAFSGVVIDHRVPIAIFLLLLAASAPRLPRRSLAIAIAAGAGLMLVARLALVETVWRRADPIYQAALAGIDALPREVRLAVAHPPGAENFVAVPQLHLATLAVGRRDAFVADLFALEGKQPVAPRPPYVALVRDSPSFLPWAAFAGGQDAARPAALRALADYDAIVFTGRDQIEVGPDPCLKPMLIAPGFQIFSIDHRPGCA